MTNESLTKTKPLASMGYVVRLEIEREFGEGEDSSLMLMVRLRDPKNDKEIDIVFDGVAQLKFSGESVALTELVLLVVEDISGRGWEGLSYRVTDAEEEFVCFLCRSIDVKGQVS
ncbi:hypothetical protein WMF28_39730 [Sorangium sp. So ce590]|uniref:hypothetical protein n=1 Tax=Sorangium sp. So ce590 TaxID=3133317 RepID=UPI003F640C7A